MGADLCNLGSGKNVSAVLSMSEVVEGQGELSRKCSVRAIKMWWYVRSIVIVMLVEVTPKSFLVTVAAMKFPFKAAKWRQ